MSLRNPNNSLQQPALALSAAVLGVAALSGCNFSGSVTCDPKATFKTVVEPGDTLTKYAQEIDPDDKLSNGDVIAEILALNAAKTTEIFSGDEITLPEPGSCRR